MASGPTTSWQVDGETMETVRDFIFFGSKIAADGECSHEIKRWLLLGRNAMTHLNSILIIRAITLQTKVHLVKGMVFPVVMYGCESWTIKKAESWRIDALNCSVGEGSLESLGLQRRSNQSIPEEMEGLMLKLKLQYFCHLMQKNQNIEKTLMLGKIEGRRRRGQQRMWWLDCHHWLDGHKLQ